MEMAHAFLIERCIANIRELPSLKRTVMHFPCAIVVRSKHARASVCMYDAQPLFICTVGFRAYSYRVE